MSPWSFAVVFSLLALTTGYPSIHSSPSTIDDSYDDLPPPVAAGTPQVDTYHDLVYGGWAVGGTSAITGTANGLIPYSPKQIAVAVTTATTATGNPGTVAAGPDLKCFDFESFYYGCTLISVAPGASTAEACTISVSGYRGSAMVGEQAFNFGQPSNPLAAPLLLADLSSNKSYKCLTNVTIAVSSGLEALLHIDDLVHINYKK